MELSEIDLHTIRMDLLEQSKRWQEFAGRNVEKAVELEADGDLEGASAYWARSNAAMYAARTRVQLAEMIEAELSSLRPTEEDGA